MNQGRVTNRYKIGLACALSCAFIWGVLPIYWKSIESVNSMLIMLYRIVSVFVLIVVVDLIIYKKERILAPLRKKGAKLTFFLAGILISANWGIYIWAVNSGHIIQTSIGYYIEPLAVCVFGVIFFHEKLDKYKLTAFLLALCGVAFMLISYGQIPIIALLLALSFACYAAIKKSVQEDALLALLYETMFLVPIALVGILYMEFTGQGAFTTSTPTEIGLLALCGLFTATPLALFAMGANRIDFITLGVTDYISPSIGLILGIFLYHEPFDRVQLISFAFIWGALVVFTLGGIKGSRKPAETELTEQAVQTGAAEETRISEAAEAQTPEQTTEFTARSAGADEPAEAEIYREAEEAAR